MFSSITGPEGRLSLRASIGQQAEIRHSIEFAVVARNQRLGRSNGLSGNRLDDDLPAIEIPNQFDIRLSDLTVSV